MKQIEVRLSRDLYLRMKRDLMRRHSFAAERVGFATGPWEQIDEKTGHVLLSDYYGLDDDRYIDDRSVGVRIDSEAIRSAMQRALDGELSKTCVFHVHLHEFGGRPRLSRTDSQEIPPMMRSVARVSSAIPHGFLVLSLDSLSAWVLSPDIDEFNETPCFVCGSPAVLTGTK